MLLLSSILPGLTSMLAYGLANAFSKPLSQKLGASQTLYLRGFTISIVLAIVSIPSYHYLHRWDVALIALVLGMAGYLPLLAFTHAIKESPLGVIAPIAGTSPLITVILSFLFLGVVLHPFQWAAVLLVIFANILVSIDFNNWHQSNLLKTSSGIPFALAAALGWGLFFFTLIPVTKILGPWLSALMAEIGVTTAAGIHIKLSSQEVAMKDSLRPSIIVNGFLICVGTLAFTVGVRYFNVAIVASLSNSVALVTTLVGLYFFREKLRMKEKIAAGLMIIGIAVLSLL